MRRPWRILLWTWVFYVITTYLWMLAVLLTSEGPITIDVALCGIIIVSPVVVPNLLLFELLSFTFMGRDPLDTLKHWSLFIGVLALVQGIGHLLLWLRYRKSARRNAQGGQMPK